MQAKALHRRLSPLPAGVDCCVVAATRSESAQGLGSSVLGDGLVPLASALGDHRDPARALVVPENRRRVVTGANHWDLLNRPEVGAQLQDWLA